MYRLNSNSFRKVLRLNIEEWCLVQKLSTDANKFFFLTHIIIKAGAVSLHSESTKNDLVEVFVSLISDILI